MQLHFDFYRSTGKRREQVHCCGARPPTGTTLKIWFHRPCLGNVMTGVPDWVFSSHTSNTRPSLFLIVPSPSKSHSWFWPPWGLEMHTLRDPCFFSIANLGTKIPHFKIFLVLANVNHFALSHWFSYCLHECMNEWINESVYLNKSLKMRNHALWDVRPRNTVWMRRFGRTSYLKMEAVCFSTKLKFLPDYAVSHSRRQTSYRQLWERW